MAWIKRNLFFFIGGLVALGLLGWAGYYNYTNWSRNEDQLAAFNTAEDTWKQLNDPVNSPGDGKALDKIQQAKDQEKDVRAWLDQAKGYFQPIAPIPAETPVTSETYAAALRRTIDQLQKEAGSAVVLPAAYAFSFSAQQSRVMFAPGSLDQLATQLGEVKTITEILYAAGVNDFDGIQRLRISDDDQGGSQTDYLTTQQTTTSGPATLTPYVVSFRSFTPEIAQVFAGFSSSHHGFLIKSFNVSPAPTDNSAPPEPPSQQGAGGGLVTVLKEKLLRVTMEVDVVKLQSKN